MQLSLSFYKKLASLTGKSSCSLSPSLKEKVDEILDNGVQSGLLLAGMCAYASGEKDSLKNISNLSINMDRSDSFSLQDLILYSSLTKSEESPARVVKNKMKAAALLLVA